MFNPMVTLFPIKLLFRRDILKHSISKIIKNNNKTMSPTLARQITVQICLKHFFTFLLKVKIRHLFLKDIISIRTITIIIARNPVCRPRKTHQTAQKMKPFIKDFFSKCDQIRC